MRSAYRSKSSSESARRGPASWGRDDCEQQPDPERSLKPAGALGGYLPPLPSFPPPVGFRRLG